jgi:HNH endonuclease/NUMOD4 motif
MRGRRGSVACWRGKFDVTEWRDIEGFDGRYQVSDTGLVRNASRLLSQHRVNSGYWVVYLWPRTVQSTWLVHRLVALAFIANPENLPEVNHKDGDKNNCSAINLEWCTRLENVRHFMRGDTERWRAGLSWAVVGEPIDGGPSVTFPSQSAAEKALSGTGKNSSAIHHCMIGKKQSAYGYRWRRA